jgi:Ca-activated chloride channel family protein
MEMFAEFHFLRPQWFYALLPMAILLWLMWKRRLPSRSWQGVVAPRLLPHLLVGQSVGRRPWSMFVLALGGLLAVTALAGPAWKKLEVPVFRQPSALVVLLDLSRSMDAGDIKPSRLQRAQMKLRDILNQQKEGETALVVYAAMPFVVSPLTSDAKTIASQVGSLSTDLMPAQGSRPDRAILMALQLLQQSGASHGGVLLISDGIDGDVSDESNDAIKALRDAGHRLSVLGVGTPEGAPIPSTNGGFLKDSRGAIVLPRLDDVALQALAVRGNGAYRRIGADDGDIRAVLAPFADRRAQLQSKQAEGMNSDQWRDEGPWLLLPLLLLGALAFRRGYVPVLLLLALPLPRPAHAMDWNSLWQNADQRGQQAMRADNAQQAAGLFKNPEWRAAANYRAGNYQAAADDLKEIGSAEAQYNRGNALAKQGQLEEAVSAYAEALKRDPQHADAKFNRDLVEEMLKQQQQDQQQGDGKDPKNKPGDNHKSGDKTGQDQSDQSNANQKSGQQDGKQADAQQKDSQASEGGQDSKQGDKPEQEKSAGDDAARQQADDKERSPQEQGVAAKQDKGEGSDKPDAAAEGQQDTREMRQADKQWLQRIPDDPGGLWRRKFLYQYKQQQQSSKSEDKTW